MSTLDLFSEVSDAYSNEEIAPVGRRSHEDIDGLTYLPSFVSKEVEDKILLALDQQPWLTDLERRVQHYGYRYNYKARRIDQSMHVGALPKWLTNIGTRLVRQGYFDEIPDQVIVNEYLPGQGISPHIDCEPCFGETIASLSLGSTCFMDFSKKDTKDQISVWLEQCSLVVLQKDARYLWRHAITKRVTDIKDGVSVKRQKRVSLTFRKVKPSWLS